MQATYAEQHEGQQSWPHNVELLLDRQRPEMLQRRDPLVGRKIVCAFEAEVHVGGEERRPGTIGQHLPGAQEIKHLYGHEHRRHYDYGGRRQDPQGAPGVERREADPCVPGCIRQQQSGNQKTRDHEEHVNPDVTTPSHLDARVV